MVTTRDKRIERWNTVMDVIISAFRDTGEPVSSNYIAAHCGLSLCPATIRNVMKELADEGYLSQPHTKRNYTTDFEGRANSVDFSRCLRILRLIHLQPGQKLPISPG